MEMCDVVADALQRAERLTKMAYEAESAGNSPRSAQLQSASNGLMLAAIVHVMFAHDDHENELWRGLFGGNGSG